MGTVLVVDDDALIREIAKDILNGGGYSVLTAGDPHEGLDILREKIVDVILLDIVLPSQSGFEMIPQIKEINPDTVVIMMTASASIESAIEAIRAGAYDYVRKPLNPEELLHSVDKALERRNLVVGNRALTQRIEERVKRLELFEMVSKAISSTLDLEKLLEKIMDIAKSVIGAEACSVLLLDEARNELLFTVALGEKGEEVKEFRIKPGQGIAGWVLQHGTPILVQDVRADGRFNKDVDEKTGFETRSMIAVPLLVKEKIIGVVEVINRTGGNPFKEEDKETLIAMAGEMAVAIENARMTEDLRRSNEQIESYSKNLEAMVLDRTKELEQANEELKAAQAHLIQTEKLSSLGQLAAGIAHELNNPIGFINSNLRVMGEYAEDIVDLIKRYETLCIAIKRNDCGSLSEICGELEETRKKMKFDFVMEDMEKLIQESRDGAYRVYKIIRDLKGFARADDTEKMVLDIHTLLDSTLNIIWNEIKYKAEVIKDYGHIPKIECFPTQLNQVFMNIFINAVQAMKEKGRITIKTYMEGERVFVEISDTGAGIPESNLGKIFDPFFTTKEPGKGTGLGLSIVYGIIKKHNGDIRVKSRVGEGTTFTVELPVNAELFE